MTREIAEELADNLVLLRTANLRVCNNYNLHRGGFANPPTKIVFGGVFRSYRFNYEEGKGIAQGSMKIMLSEDIHCQCDVTVVILNDSEAEAGATGERIVHNTRKLSDFNEADFNEAVLEAYFSAYCSTINKWIIVYEKFESYFDSEHHNAVPQFSDEADNMLSLNEFWREKLGSLVRVLAASKKKHVTHGGLSLATGHAISSGTIKLVNVARCVPKSGNDLEGMRQFLGSNKYLEANSCPDWPGFDFLLRMKSRKMDHSDWDTAVLKHPILLKASMSGKLNAYEGVEINMWQRPQRNRERFASALSIMMPEHEGRIVWSFFDDDDPYLHELMKYSNPHSDIYLSIIQTVRNLDRHTEHLDETVRCQVIHTRFPGYMSMAYSVSKLSESEWFDIERLGFQKKLDIKS